MNMRCLIALSLLSMASARLMATNKACVASDLKHRMDLQNKLAGVCVDMCKEVGAFPKCTCPNFVAPDSTPGVMTWPELLEHMDNLSEWGHGQLKQWSSTAAIQLHSQEMQGEKACLAQDLDIRMQMQNKLAGVCVDMCKEVGAFPKCTCPNFVAPDSTPGVMTWPELLEHMDNLSEWGHGELKTWSATATSFVALDSDLKTTMLVQKVSGITDPCSGITCAANLKCPAGFTVTEVEGHCCPYCVNPNIKLEAAITGATGTNGGKASTFCPKVWCFPTMCTKAASNPTTTNGQCCTTCPAL